MRRYPTQAVVAISVGVLAPVVLGGVLAALGIWAGVVVTRHFEALSKAESDTLVPLGAAVILAVLGAVIFNRFADPRSQIMPTLQTQTAFDRAFSGRFDPAGGQEIVYNAAFGNYVGLPKPIVGWSAWARFRRARVIAQSIPKKAPRPAASRG